MLTSRLFIAALSVFFLSYSVVRADETEDRVREAVEKILAVDNPDSDAYQEMNYLVKVDLSGHEYQVLRAEVVKKLKPHLTTGGDPRRSRLNIAIARIFIRNKTHVEEIEDFIIEQLSNGTVFFRASKLEGQLIDLLFEFSKLQDESIVRLAQFGVRLKDSKKIDKIANLLTRELDKPNSLQLFMNTSGDKKARRVMALQDFKTRIHRSINEDLERLGSKAKSAWVKFATRRLPERAELWAKMKNWGEPKFFPELDTYMNYKQKTGVGLDSEEKENPDAPFESVFANIVAENKEPSNVINAAIEKLLKLDTLKPQTIEIILNFLDREDQNPARSPLLVKIQHRIPWHITQIFLAQGVAYKDGQLLPKNDFVRCMQAIVAIEMTRSPGSLTTK